MFTYFRLYRINWITRTIRAYGCSDAQCSVCVCVCHQHTVTISDLLTICQFNESLIGTAIAKVTSPTSRSSNSATLLRWRQLIYCPFWGRTVEFDVLLSCTRIRTAIIKYTNGESKKQFNHPLGNFFLLGLLMCAVYHTENMCNYFNFVCLWLGFPVGFPIWLLLVPHRRN